MYDKYWIQAVYANALGLAAVRSTSRRVGIRARDIGGIIRDPFPDSVYTARDIYNARARPNRENLGGYSSTAALIKLFDDKGIPYIAEWASDEPSRLVGLVWTFLYCLQMWKRFSEVISFDNTYNTNRFKLPLFQVTGQTCLGTVFNAAFGLIDNERLEGFQFLAKGITTLLRRNGIRVPDVVITDFDNQMKKALEFEFPVAQQQLCIHHINSNVMLQSKRRWVYSAKDKGTGEESSSDDPDATLNQRDQQAVRASARQEEPVALDNLHQPVPHDYNGVLVLWKLVVFAETEEDHEKAWECLCRQFGDQRAILAYLYSTYMPVRAQWARCFIRKYRNFGIRVTSGTEASNNNIKSYLLNGMSHLYRLVEAIQGMLEDQEREFRQACAQDEVLTAREHEHRKALKGIPSSSKPWPDDVGTCGDECNVSFELGVPCHHTIYAKLTTATPLTKWDVHPRWHLREPPQSGRAFFGETTPDGRKTIVEITKTGLKTVLPSDFSAENSVYGYGGAIFDVLPDNRIIFSNRDNTILLLNPDSGAVSLLVESTVLHYGSFSANASLPWVLAIEEDRTDSTSQGAQNFIAAINVDTGEVKRVVTGADFYFQPRFSADGTRLSWTQYNRPELPYTDAKLHWADWSQDGAVTNVRLITGENRESVAEPRWGPDGSLFFAKEIGSYRQLFRIPSGSGEQFPIKLAGLESAEFSFASHSEPINTYAILTKDRVLATPIINGVNHVISIDITTGEWQLVANPETICQVLRDSVCRYDDTSALVIGAGTINGNTVHRIDAIRPELSKVIRKSMDETLPTSLFAAGSDVRWADLEEKDWLELEDSYLELFVNAQGKKVWMDGAMASTNEDFEWEVYYSRRVIYWVLTLRWNLRFEAQKWCKGRAHYCPKRKGKFFARPESIHIRSKDLPARDIHGFIWMPHNPTYKAPESELPPLIIQTHGGPTSHAGCGLMLPIQYFTSRGYAYVELNYTGSTGYGREYRQALFGNWGVLDRDDVVELADHLVASGRVRIGAVGVTGASAGGYITLQVLSKYSEKFAGGVCLCGVSDLETLDKDTHKIESDSVPALVLHNPAAVGTEKLQTYRERSALYNAKGIISPLLLIHGQDDTSVPIEQARKIYQAMAKHMADVKLIEVPEEGHMLSRPATVRLLIAEEEKWWRKTLLRLS
ncbi:transposase [Pochonia chlamydosporia 170]|uniref:Transposase n=1 Tax=Pochonia chlamydosporia 170 TaxID=1380566 RepID=A0A179EXD9_METCM|nr:transposase [Pochonia chlamydosporia 170]OAQ57846.1 transposase [Pochonia chlamydosporia 170]